MSNKIEVNHLKVSETFSEAWECFVKNPAEFIGSTVILLIAILVLNFVPYLGMFAGTLIGFVAFKFFYLKLNNQKAEFKDLFEPLTDLNLLGHLVVAHLLVSIFCGIGFIFLIIPGLYLMVVYSFVIPILLFQKKVDFWQAMESSRKTCHQHFFWVAWFWIAWSLVLLAGFLALGIGLLAAVPVSYLMLVSAYKRLFEVGQIEVNIDLSGGPGGPGGGSTAGGSSDFVLE